MMRASGTLVKRGNAGGCDPPLRSVFTIAQCVTKRLLLEEKLAAKLTDEVSLEPLQLNGAPRSLHSASLHYIGRSRDDAPRRLPRTIAPLRSVYESSDSLPCRDDHRSSVFVSRGDSSSLPLRYRGRSHASRAYHAPQNDRIGKGLKTRVSSITKQRPRVEGR